ncbi:Mannosyl phosphorylinositol ceramide synthase SUR1 [Penicillium argentinense]|uniref:Mannosyl phosphorylinositol ceramide synthase SUR1 n=1 Tax=Penicillium argentinense TaxID=1131581 RepID=A0A9W9G1C4_9EURO|nr:Mannosyl phosphorylinositol ceramide synthase SUR1 [Penicillium argentinense]KAJ5109805.1 Mannosyl phosphorylinositol ceramide synthase SUR1 [Penicillium argentinense]
MRRGLLIFVLVNLLVLSLLIRSVSTLLSLLVEDAAADAIHRAELPSPNSSLIEQRPQIIPKIIHQTYKNETIPEVWRDAQQSCIDLHPDYEYILWTNEKSREFIAAEYPWFLDTFDGYKYPIQRADSIRYFVLAHYGGTYIDLDDGCNRRLDPLLAYPAWVRRTVPTGISNDAMGSVPQHPFFLRVIELLQQYDRSWLLPYITVMYSTGPLFLSVIWKEYMLDKPVESGRVRILMQDEYNRFSWSFFTHHTGNSWHGKDAHLIFWMGQHWMFLTFLGFLLAAVVGFCLFWTYGRVMLLGAKYRYRYTKVPTIITPSRLSSSPTRRARRLMPTFIRRVSFKEDEETGGATETSYELGRRDD